VFLLTMTLKSICSFFFDHSSYRAKVFRGKKVHGEFDIKVEQVGCFFFFYSSKLPEQYNSTMCLCNELDVAKTH